MLHVARRDRSPCIYGEARRRATYRIWNEEGREQLHSFLEFLHSRSHLPELDQSSEVYRVSNPAALMKCVICQHAPINKAK